MPITYLHMCRAEHRKGAPLQIFREFSGIPLVSLVELLSQQVPAIADPRVIARHPFFEQLA